MLTMEPTSMMVIILCRATASVGKRGNEKRMNPYVPIFNSTPARITEPAVGASVCASGSQVWNGNIGTLHAKKKKNTQKKNPRGGGKKWRPRPEERGNVKSVGGPGARHFMGA